MSSLKNLMSHLTAEPVEASVAVQITGRREQITKSGKPYFDLEISDGETQERVKIWSDSAAFRFVQEGAGGEFVELSGRFSRNDYGLNWDGAKVRNLEEAERDTLLAGSPERQTLLNALLEEVATIFDAVQDPRLRLLALEFLRQYGPRFQRAAAARDFHHARRGGLLEHTAQMLRGAGALSEVYPNLNWELVKTGVLFHDSGKLWENDYREDGFEMPHTRLGELLGHIPIGLELVNRLWRECETQEAFKQPGTPSAQAVKEHLLHLVASHHGTKEFGSPVTPRTPEAAMLHYLDNIDAKLEMFRSAYAEKPEIAPGIFDRRPPLEGKPVASLSGWNAA
jgi:3'-5' exoribonuclease